MQVGTGVEQQGSQMTLENFQAMQGLPRPPSLPDMTANLLGQMASSTNPQVSAHSQPATTSSEASSSSPPQVNGGLPATTAATSYEHWHYGAMGMQPGSSTVPYPGIADPKQMASMPLGQVRRHSMRRIYIQRFSLGSVSCRLARPGLQRG